MVFFSRSLWHWPLTQISLIKKKGFIYWSGPTSKSTLKAIGQGIVRVVTRTSLKKGFVFKVTVTLTFNPNILKKKGSSTGQAQPPSQLWRPYVKALLGYHSDKLKKGFCVQGPLTQWPQNKKGSYTGQAQPSRQLWRP